MKTMYSDRMNCPENSSFSPSAGKPKELINYLIAKGVKPDIYSDFAPVTFEELTLAHDKVMVQEILSLKQTNGFGNRLKSVADSLPYTSGSFLAAALYAIKNKENVFSPTSGFHHARFASCGGFCTFNGLMIAALKLKELGLIKNLAIIDCDMHFGDGTEDIIKRLGLDWIKHYTFGRDHICHNESEQWLDRFPQILARNSEVDLVFYQAGADPHINDPLGGVLTTDQLKRRDEIVFRHYAELDIPVVWNLAGGYQKPLEKVLEIHHNTYQVALKYSVKEVV